MKTSVSGAALVFFSFLVAGVATGDAPTQAPVQAPGTQTPGTQTPGTQTPGTQTPGTQTPGTQAARDPFSLPAAEKPVSTEPPKPAWPKLGRRVARFREDRAAAYLSTELAYVGYYRRGSEVVAGFRVPERNQLVYARAGEAIWNGAIGAIGPKQVMVRYRAVPGGPLKSLALDRVGYGKAKPTAAGTGPIEPPVEDGDVSPPAKSTKSGEPGKPAPVPPVSPPQR